MMGSLSIWHWLIFAIVAALLFGGKGKLSSIMGDAAKGIKAFKEGLKGDEHEAHVVQPAGVLASDTAVREAAAREQAARDVLARETAAREAAEQRARQDVGR